MADILRYKGAGGEEHNGVLFLDKQNKEAPDDSLRLAALGLSHGLTDQDLIHIAAKKGLAFGLLGSQFYNGTQAWLGEQYEINVEAMRDLGYTSRQIEEETPSYDDIIKGIGVKGLMVLGRRHALGKRDALMVVPNIRKIGLIGTKRSPGLLPRYNRKEGEATRAVTRGVWDSFGDKAMAHDPLAGRQANWIVSIALDDGTRGREAGGADLYGERGIVYDALPTEEQRRIILADREVSEFEHPFRLGSMTVAQYVVRCAQLRAQGAPLLDSRMGHEKPDATLSTSTGFINYGDITRANGRTLVPAAYTDRGRIVLHERAAQPTQGGGVRKVIQLVET